MIGIDPIGRKADPNEWFGQQLFEITNQDATPAVVEKENIHYAIEIDVSDNTDIADEKEIGLFNDPLLNGGDGGSVFRWVTDRPTYDGSTIVPTGDLTTINATKWAEGMINSEDKLGMPIRLININIAGAYGSLSGFQFSLDNVKQESGNFIGQMFFDILDDNSMFILNRKIRFYIILGDVFFNVWSGIVTKVSHNETNFDIICEDDFRNLHKTIPPQIANETLFPEILKKSIGKSIPVTLGLNNHAKLLNIQVRNESLIIFNSNGVDRGIAPLRDYSVTLDSSGNVTFVSIVINIGSKITTANELKGKFLRFILDGGSDDAFKILGSGIPTKAIDGTNLISLNLDGEVSNQSDLVIPDITVTFPIEVGTWVEIFDFESNS